MLVLCEYENQYFQSYAILLRLLVIHLGETEGYGIRKGFFVDSGSDPGQRAELIGTQEQLLEKLKTFDSSPEVNLHKAVIMQAIIDATNMSNCNRARRFEIEAKSWLFGNSREFLETCDIAKISPCEVRKIAKNAMAMHLKEKQIRADKQNTHYDVNKVKPFPVMKSSTRPFKVANAV